MACRSTVPSNINSKKSCDQSSGPTTLIRRKQDLTLFTDPMFSLPLLILIAS